MYVEPIELNHPWKTKLTKALSEIHYVDQDGLTIRPTGIGPTERNLLEITVCMLWLRKQNPRKTISKLCTSYGLKHQVEREMGHYVSNGSFIAAAILQGLKIQRCGSLNAYLALGKAKPLSVEDHREARQFLEEEFNMIEEHY